MNVLSLSNRRPVTHDRLPEMDRLLDQVFSGRAFASSPYPPRPVEMQVHENDLEFRVAVDLPGVEAKDIELSFQDGALTLKARREASEQNSHYSNRWTGSVECSTALGPDVEADRIGASLKNGVLTVTLPKKPEYQPRRIQIE